MEALFALPYGPFVIFLMRIVDVSMGTVRMIIMVRGHRAVAAAIGFGEVLVWLLAVGNALQYLDSPYHVVGYAAGFAAGNYVGIMVEEQLALGLCVVRAILRREPEKGATVRRLRSEGYGVTTVVGEGREGTVDILNTVVPRKETSRVIELIEAHAPDAFMTVEEVRSTRHGHLQPKAQRRRRRLVHR